MIVIDHADAVDLPESNNHIIYVYDGTNSLQFRFDPEAPFGNAVARRPMRGSRQPSIDEYLRQRGQETMERRIPCIRGKRGSALPIIGKHKAFVYFYDNINRVDLFAVGEYERMKDAFPRREAIRFGPRLIPDVWLADD